MTGSRQLCETRRCGAKRHGVMGVVGLGEGSGEGGTPEVVMRRRRPGAESARAWFGAESWGRGLAAPIGCFARLVLWHARLESGW